MEKRRALHLLGGEGMDLAEFFSNMRRITDKRDIEMKAKTNLRTNQLGFTFPEMLIVMILIAIIAGISYGAFNRMGVNSSLRTAARDIASDFQLARQRAMAENTNLTITFDPVNHTYTVPQGGGGTLTKSLASYSAGIIFTSVNLLGGNIIVFQPRGTTQQWGNVALQNNRGSTATIAVNSTGRANVQFEMH
jgi:prepilin-type N-terminal cleavage/methylation domain-containing protein